MENTRFKLSQYACAVLLVVSSIALVSYQVIMIDDVSNGLLVYVAQAFLQRQAALKSKFKCRITKSIGPIDCVMHTKHRQVFLLTRYDKLGWLSS